MTSHFSTLLTLEDFT